MTQVLDAKAVAQALKDNQGTLEALGEAWKQVNAPFGQFAQGHPQGIDRGAGQRLAE